MRVINLDETGIKLINSKKNQIYITKETLKDFVAGKYTIIDHNLQFDNKTLSLSTEELNTLPTLIKYIKTEILKE